MSISEDEVYKDFLRFIRHEAMRANCKQYEIYKIINNESRSNQSNIMD